MVCYLFNPNAKAEEFFFFCEKSKTFLVQTFYPNLQSVQQNRYNSQPPKKFALRIIAKFALNNNNLERNTKISLVKGPKGF